MITSSIHSKTVSYCMLTCLRHKHLSVSETLKPINLMCLVKDSYKSRLPCGSRNALEDQAMIAGGCAWVHKNCGVGPQKRHMHPYFAVQVCGEKRNFLITRLELEGVAGSISEQHSQCGGLTNGAQVIALTANVHDLPSNILSSLQLPGLQLAQGSLYA